MTEEIAETPARVQGEGRRLGRTTDDIPDGYISWEEHYLAWEVYARQHRGQSARDIESRGGFSYRELQKYLGRNPETWKPRDEIRFAHFKLATEDAPGYEPPDPNKPTHPVESHIWYVGGEMKICEDNVMVPEGPVAFDEVRAPGCQRCFKRMVDWLDWFTDPSKKEAEL